ncbi:MAG: hypothetical protein ACI4UN_08945 [Muribaculaceae bacterium]
MKRFISNYILFNSTQHTNSVLCVDNDVITVSPFEVETAATLYVEGAIVVAPDNALTEITGIFHLSSSLHDAIAAMLPLTALPLTGCHKTLLQISFSPKIMHTL